MTFSLRLLRIIVLICLLLPLSLQAQDDLIPDEPTTIRIFWGNDGGEDIILRDLLQQFEADNDIDVQISLISHGDGPTQFIDAIESDTPPDLIRHTYYSAMSPYYLDLRPYLSNADVWDVNFNDGILQALRGDNDDSDALYGFLTEFTVSAPYINRTLWEKSGVPIPGDGVRPASWPEWERASMQVQAILSTADHPVYAMMIDRTGHRFWGPSLGMCANYFADDGAIQVDSPGFRATAEMLRRWHVSGLMPDTIWDDSSNRVEAERYFVDGQAAFYIGGSWQVGSFERDISDNFDWVVVPNPIGNDNGDCDGRSGMPGGQVLTAIEYEGQSEEQKLAIGALMSYLTQPEKLQRFYEDALFLPSYAALQVDNLNYAAGEVQLNAFRNEIAEIDRQAYQLQYHPVSDHIRSQIRAALVNYIQGRMSLDQAIESARQNIDRALEDEID